MEKFLDTIMGTFKFINFNSILDSLGITELSFLGFVKIIFLIIFITLNLCLLYIESLDAKHTNKDISHMKSGMTPELKRLVKYFISGVGLYASYIAIKNEHKDTAKEAKLLKQKEADLAEFTNKAALEVKQIANVRIANNFANKLHLNSIQRTVEKVTKNKEEQTELHKAIKEQKVQWENDKDSKLLQGIEVLEVKLEALIVEGNRAESELIQDVARGVKYSEEISKETDEAKILAILNEDIKKSSILDLEELWTKWKNLDLEELWITFASFNGITKLACSMIFSSYFILWCTLSVVINLYGEYLLNRFKLEEKHPRLALFILYRKKVSKYYILSNIIYIILTCLMNIIFGLSILTIVL